MNESYVLILNAVVLSVGNFALWRLLFDENFVERLNFSEIIYTDQVNNVDSKQADDLDDSNNVIQDYIKPENMIENSNLIKKRVSIEARALQQRTIWVYYFTLGVILFATVGLLIPKGVVISSASTIYMTSISWWILVSGVLCMLGLLVHFQLIEQKMSKPAEGERIRGNTGIKSLIDLLKSKLPI